MRLAPGRFYAAAAFAGLGLACIVGGAAAGGSAPTPVPTAVAIPALDHPAFGTCVRNYPDELNAFPIAFDGTIVKEENGSNGESEREPHMTPRVVTFQVENVYRGNVGRTIVMRTWDYEASTPNASHVGERFLVASEQSRDIQFCGYTRPYSEQDAAYWAHTFSNS